MQSRAAGAVSESSASQDETPWHQASSAGLLSELFRRALSGDQSAWTRLACELGPLMQVWAAQQVYIDAAPVLDAAWTTFIRSIPAQFHGAEELQLVALLAHLRTCVKQALLQHLRPERRAASSSAVSPSSWITLEAGASPLMTHGLPLDPMR